jgi:hypothetical protein
MRWAKFTDIAHGLDAKTRDELNRKNGLDAPERRAKRDREEEGRKCETRTGTCRHFALLPVATVD